jgi:hypothetical protein
MDADGEHQEDYADFGHDLEGVDVVDLKAGSEGAEDQSGEDIAKQDGLAETPSQESADKCSSENHGDVAIDEGVFRHVDAQVLN